MQPHGGYHEARKQDGVDHRRQQRHRACDRASCSWPRAPRSPSPAATRRRWRPRPRNWGRTRSRSSPTPPMSRRPKPRSSRRSKSSASSTSSSPMPAFPAIRRSAAPRSQPSKTSSGPISPSVFFTVQAALPHLNDGASIILNGSVISVLGNPGYSAYAASKAGVRAMARVMASELSPRSIRVNVVAPGATAPRSGVPATATPEAEKAFEKRIGRSTPLGRLGEADHSRQDGAVPGIRRCVACPGPGDLRRRRRDQLAGRRADLSRINDRARINWSRGSAIRRIGCAGRFLRLADVFSCSARSIEPS